MITMFCSCSSSDDKNIHVLLLCVLDALCGLSSPVRQGNIHTELISKLRDTIQDSLLDGQKGESAIPHLHCLTGVLKVVSGSQIGKRNVSSFPFSAYCGVVSLCCSFVSINALAITDAMIYTVCPDDVFSTTNGLVEAINSLLAVYQSVCRVESEDSFIDSLINGMMKEVIDRNMFEKRPERIQISYGRTRKRRRGRSTYHHAHIDFSSSSDSEEVRDSDDEGETECIDTSQGDTLMDSQGSLKEDEGELDACSIQIIDLLRDVYRNMPTEYVEKLESTDSKIHFELFSSSTFLTERRFRRDEYDRIRRMLFALRGDICIALKILIDTYQKAICPTQVSHDLTSSLVVVKFFSCELKTGIKDGLTIRNFKVNVHNR